MNILGIDPSPDGKHCCVYNDIPLILTSVMFQSVASMIQIFQPHPSNGFSGISFHYLGECINVEPDIIILERPVPQGERTRLAHYTPLCIEYGKLLQNLQQLYLQARIFEVPANVIRQQAGYTTRQGRADPFVKRYLETLGYECGRGKLFNSTHKRDALMCALFAWNDKRNSMYETTEVAG